MKTDKLEDKAARDVRDEVFFEINGMLKTAQFEELDGGVVEALCPCGMRSWTLECREVLQCVKKRSRVWSFVVLRQEVESLKGGFLIRCVAVRGVLIEAERKKGQLKDKGLDEWIEDLGSKLTELKIRAQEEITVLEQTVEEMTQILLEMGNSGWRRRIRTVHEERMLDRLDEFWMGKRLLDQLWKERRSYSGRWRALA